MQRIFANLCNVKSLLLVTIALLLLMTGLISLNLTALARKQSQRPKEQIIEQGPVRQLTASDFTQDILQIVKVNNLQSPDFPKGFQAEVKNVSNKPIYFILINFMLPNTDKRSTALRFLYARLIYGNPKLVTIKEPITSKDTPLNPGQRVTLDIPAERATVIYDELVNFKQDFGVTYEIATQKVSLMQVMVRFGDGTYNKFGKEYPDQASLRRDHRFMAYLLRFQDTGPCGQYESVWDTCIDG
jgi:hypothetical protein